jgi:photosynthetic reaction center H subunit
VLFFEGETVMGTGAITQYVDVAQIVLYMFWIFFAGLIYYLIREGHREGYPMDSGRENGPVITGWPMPEPKTYRLANGREVQAPDFNRADGSYQAQPVTGLNGAPLEPVGNPLTAGVGPGAWAARADEVDRTLHGEAKIVPLRRAPDHGVASKDVDPRGMSVHDAQGQVAGTVHDLWVDRMEMMFRYLEVSTPSGRQVLVPMTFARITRQGITVHALLAEQFEGVPATRNPEEITLLEEEKITAYFGAGTLYATPERQEPLL